MYASIPTKSPPLDMNVRSLPVPTCELKSAWFVKPIYSPCCPCCSLDCSKMARFGKRRSARVGPPVQVKTFYNAEASSGEDTRVCRTYTLQPTKHGCVEYSVRDCLMCEGARLHETNFMLNQQLQSLVINFGIDGIARLTKDNSKQTNKQTNDGR
jgi:hypothetical protein